MAVERQWRKPRLTTNSPVLIGRTELGRLVQSSEVNLDLVIILREDRRSALLTKVSTFVGARFPIDGDRILGKNRRSEEQCAVVLSAIKAVTKSDAIGVARRCEAHVSTQATARHFSLRWIILDGHVLSLL